MDRVAHLLICAATLILFGCGSVSGPQRVAYPSQRPAQRDVQVTLLDARSYQEHLQHGAMEFAINGSEVCDIDNHAYTVDSLAGIFETAQKHGQGVVLLTVVGENASTFYEVCTAIKLINDAFRRTKLCSLSVFLYSPIIFRTSAEGGRTKSDANLKDNYTSN